MIDARIKKIEFDTFIDNQKTSRILLMIDDQVIGTSMLTVIAKKLPTVYGVYVKPSYRGLGLSKDMIEHWERVILDDEEFESNVFFFFFSLFLSKSSKRTCKRATDITGETTRSPFDRCVVPCHQGEPTREKANAFAAAEPSRN